MSENTKQEKVYGKYTVKSTSRKGKDNEDLISGIICITDDGKLKPIGHFVYTCCLGVNIEGRKDRKDFETFEEYARALEEHTEAFKECADIVAQYLEEMSAMTKEQEQ